jgi:adenylate cyclase
MTSAEFEAAGLYDPTSPRAAERLELLESLAAAGVTIEEMQAANERGQLVFLLSSSELRPGPYLTQQELADRLGQTADVLERFRVAFALPPVRPGGIWCNENEARMFEAVAGGVALFGEKGMLRLTRVIGASASRVAEAMVTANLERMRGLLGEGATELDQARSNLEAIRGADGPGRILTALLSIHLQIAASQVRRRRGGIEDETLNGCVGFVDLVGSTTLSRRLSATELAAVVDRFEEVAHEVAINRHGRIVKFIGDEVMFVTGDAASACDIALALIEAFEGDPAVQPRAGLAWGALLDRGGDYYGPVVNLAARLAELAVPSEVLVTTEVAEAIDDYGLRSEAAGRRLLRGFDEPIALRSVSRA